jgi:two-component system, NarL family, invasion response regulator UvrY
MNFAAVSHRKIRVGVCDDHPIVRAGLRELIAHQTDMELTAETADGRDALDIARQGQCDVLLLDILLPGQNGVDTLRSIRARQPQFPVLMLSSFPEQQYALPMLKLGANGYLRKDCETDELLKAIRSAATGGRYVTVPVGNLLASEWGRPEDAPPHAALTDRELQVFLRLSRGEAVTAIARSLNLSFKTISTYRARILEKLELKSNCDLTYYALKQGLIE